jgi:MYXO-CTERM domain-containing protein
VGGGGTVWAAPGAGTTDDPIVIDALPYFAAGSTVGAPSSAIDAYDCDPGLDESGAEVVYRFALEADARVTAWVDGDGGMVDIDVHLLDDLVLDGTTATGCVARANRIAEAEMTAGTHYVAIDSYAGAAQRGPFVLRVYAIGEGWTEIPIGEGVVWRARRYMDPSAGPQVLHVVDADPSVGGVSFEVVDPDGCQTVSASAAGHAVRPVAAVNSSFFAFDGVCTSTTFMKHDGTVLAYGNDATLALAGPPMVTTLSGGSDWPRVTEAQGGRGMLVEDGIPTQGSAAWSAQGIGSASFLGPNPRTFAGYRAEGTYVFGTIDGRRPNAMGMSLDAQALLAADELGCEGAVNWDGGGSTTMWVADMTPNGVVNYPSDGGMFESMDHAGSRPDGGAVFVHADPYNWPPRFQTQPPGAGTAVGASYGYDADAIDLNVEDTVTFSLVEGPGGMTIDASSGELSFSPTAASPPQALVTIAASDGHGGEATQAWMLDIEGGMGGSDESGDGGGASDDGPGGTAGSGGDGPGDAGGDSTTFDADSDADDSGCGCRTRGDAGPWSLALAGLGLGLAWRRRRARPPRLS